MENNKSCSAKDDDEGDMYISVSGKYQEVRTDEPTNGSFLVPQSQNNCNFKDICFLTIAFFLMNYTVK